MEVVKLVLVAEVTYCDGTTAKLEVVKGEDSALCSEELVEKFTDVVLNNVQ
jgi:hypothetical protein